MSPTDLVGPAEVRALAGVSSSVVSNWRNRQVMPAPLTVLAMGPVWDRAEIEEWLAGREAQKQTRKALKIERLQAALREAERGL